MRMTLAGLLTVALLTACENRRADRESGAAENERTGVDTVVTTERIADTTIVRADTTIDVDTIKDTDHITEENR
ncbi:MAG TPA: hypothetical protein VFZ26_13060 [Gemmatimonadales bacterium]